MPITKIAHSVKLQLRYILFFGFLFLFAGWLIPEIYFKYFDTTQYYRITIPIQLDKKIYSACDSQMGTTVRVSYIDTIIEYSRVLVNITSPSEPFKILSTVKQATLPVKRTPLQGETIYSAYQIPCDTEDGIYFWEGVALYTYRNNEKTFYVNTETFTIKNNSDIHKE